MHPNARNGCQGDSDNHWGSTWLRLDEAKWQAETGDTLIDDKDPSADFDEFEIAKEES